MLDDQWQRPLQRRKISLLQYQRTFIGSSELIKEPRAAWVF